MAQAADAVTLLAAVLFVGTVVTWLSYAASRSSDALEDDRALASEPQLRRSVPVVVTVLFVLAVVAMVVLSALVPAAA